MLVIQVQNWIITRGDAQFRILKLHKLETKERQQSKQTWQKEEKKKENIG